MTKESEIKVYVTDEYDKFRKLLGNRDVTPTRLSAIKESILRIGYQPSPILVNEKMEVIDGQGRLAACEALNLKVYFIIKEGLTITDCISMNIKMKNWTEVDYINCYADRGYANYVNLREMLSEFPLLNWEFLYIVSGQTRNKNTSDELKNGRLKFEKFNYRQYEQARWISAMVPIIKKSRLQTRSAIETLLRLDRWKLIERRRMLDSIEKYANTVEYPSYKAADTLAILNDIYNFNRKQKVFFADDYRRIADTRLKRRRIDEQQK